jgi:hypothetical protein
MLNGSDSSTPLPLAYASPPAPRPRRPLVLVVIAVSAVLAGMLVGATTNAVNGAVSPTYFMIVMGWDDTGVWFASVQEGILEGLVIGIFLSAILTIAIGIITRATCSYREALRWLVGVVIAVYVFWAVGGILGVAWAAASPVSYQNTFIFRPLGFWQTVRFAWVGGTIWGAYFGGLLAVAVGLIVFHLKWKRQMMRESGAAG